MPIVFATAVALSVAPVLILLALPGDDDLLLGSSLLLNALLVAVVLALVGTLRRR